MYLRRRAVVVALVALLAACGDADMGVRAGGAADRTRVEQGTSTTSTVTGPATTAAPTTGSPTTGPDEADGLQVVELLDPGTEPRRLLRMALVPGLVIDQTARVDQRLDLQVGGIEQSIDQQSTVVTRHRVVSVEGGRATLAVSYLDFTSSTPGLESLIEQIKAITIDMVVDDLGRIIELDADLSSVTSPLLSQLLDGLLVSLRQSAFALPSEAVGIGASWRSTAELLAGGIPTKIVQDVTLTSDDGTRVGFEVAAVVSEGDGEIEIPGLPAGAVVSDLDIEGTVSGSGELQLDLLLPDVTSDSEIEISYVLSMDGDEQKATTRTIQSTDATVKAA